MRDALETDMSTFTTSRALVLVSTLASSALLGCAHDKPQPPETASMTTTTSTQVTATTPMNHGNVRLSDGLLQQCKVDVNNVASAPKFHFDQAQIEDGDRGVLDQIATCVTSGPLKGTKLELVGRADPRGEAEYNMALGSSRADAVASYLKSAGVPASQLGETSRGKLDATGTDEQSWAMDRRVDIDVSR